MLQLYSPSQWLDRGKLFPTRPFNIMDPLMPNNNLGRSVSRASFYRLRKALRHGAVMLAQAAEQVGRPGTALAPSAALRALGRCRLPVAERSNKLHCLSCCSNSMSQTAGSCAAGAGIALTVDNIQLLCYDK